MFGGYINNIFKKLGLVIVVAFLIRLYFVLGFSYISPDGTHYASLGENLLHSGEYISNGSHFPDIIQPPLYPFLLGILSLLMPAALAGKMVSLLFGVALVVLVNRFFTQLFPKKNMGVWAGWLTALHPGLIAVSSQVATESLYLFLMSALFYNGWKLLHFPDKQKIVLSSLLLGTAYWVRPEALPFFIIIQLIFTVLWLRKKLSLKLWSLHLLPFALFFMLYATMSSLNLGYFNISPKMQFVRTQGQLVNYIKQTEPQLTIQQQGLKARYLLSADTSRLASHAMLAGDTETLNHYKVESHKKPPRMQRLKKLAAYISFNIKQIAYRLLKGSITPLSFWVLALMGIFFFIKYKPFKLSYLLYMVTMLSPLGVYLITHVEERFLFLFIPFVLVFFALGLAELEDVIRKKWQRGTVLRVGLIIILFLSMIPNYNTIIEKLNAKSYQKPLSERIAKAVEKNAIIASVSPASVFYAQRQYRAVPIASINAMLHYFSKQNVGYLLMEEGDAKKRPEYSKIKNGANPVFKPVLNNKIEGRHYWLYKIINPNQ